jgi:hypothetical protein
VAFARIELKTLSNQDGVFQKDWVKDCEKPPCLYILALPVQFSMKKLELPSEQGGLFEKM